MQPGHATEGATARTTPGTRPAVDVVVPIYNEAAVIERTVMQVSAALGELPYRFQVTLADNASTDATPEICRRLAEEHPFVRVLRLEQKGRGRALHAAWSSSDADVLAYTDADLSTRLDALGPLLAAVAGGAGALAIGSRLLPASNVNRGFKRETISRGYNLLLRLALGVHVHDAQCGFKAISAAAARDLLPIVEDGGWFFDTELIVAAQRTGRTVLEIPVDWVDDPDSSVALVRTAVEDLKGIARLVRSHRRSVAPLQVTSPAAAPVAGPGPAPGP